ncbi:hypothetical protein PHET_10610 [Paragonimus heterotremus]|uniref:Uncharacterized protein n=1 Tax=Paragonimus heterotremus TaxID=100268 RepID=A0A8J4T1F7_9TREM|nr:hypothetical protein PHET_10610 [Paragonimus heterotremus]
MTCSPSGSDIFPLPHPYTSPPYLTAKPDVTCFELLVVWLSVTTPPDREKQEQTQTASSISITNERNNIAKRYENQSSNIGTQLSQLRLPQQVRKKTAFKRALFAARPEDKIVIYGNCIYKFGAALDLGRRMD